MTVLVDRTNRSWFAYNMMAACIQTLFPSKVLNTITNQKLSCVAKHINLVQSGLCKSGYVSVEYVNTPLQLSGDCTLITSSLERSLEMVGYPNYMKIVTTCKARTRYLA